MPVCSYSKLNTELFIVPGVSGLQNSHQWRFANWCCGIIDK